MASIEPISTSPCAETKEDTSQQDAPAVPHPLNDMLDKGVSQAEREALFAQAPAEHRVLGRKTELKQCVNKSKFSRILFSIVQRDDQMGLVFVEATGSESRTKVATDRWAHAYRLLLAIPFFEWFALSSDLSIMGSLEVQDKIVPPILAKKLNAYKDELERLLVLHDRASTTKKPDFNPQLLQELQEQANQELERRYEAERKAQTTPASGANASESKEEPAPTAPTSVPAFKPSAAAEAPQGASTEKVTNAVAWPDVIKLAPNPHCKTIDQAFVIVQTVFHLDNQALETPLIMVIGVEKTQDRALKVARAVHQKMWSPVARSSLTEPISFPTQIQIWPLHAVAMLPKGDVSHETRGPLLEKFEAVMEERREKLKQEQVISTDVTMALQGLNPLAESSAIDAIPDDL